MQQAICEAFVALGSNIEPERHLAQAARGLQRHFQEVLFSPCYRNRAYGFEGADFINAVARFATGLPITALLQVLRAIETEGGRGRDDPKWGARAIDLDLLLYGEEVGSGPGYTLPRPDLMRRVYMLGPLAELAPERRLPPAGPTFAELWSRYPHAQYPLERVALDLNAL